MREPNAHPDALDGFRLAPIVAALLALALVVSLSGCGGAAGIASVAGAVKTTLDVLRQTRQVLCTPALDPLMGDPRDGQPQWVQKDAGAPADGGADGIR